MDSQEHLKRWQQQLQKVQVGEDVQPELQVLLGETIQAFQAASTLFSKTHTVLHHSQRAHLSHQEAFRDLMCVEARRNALWNLRDSVRSLWTMIIWIDDEGPAGDASHARDAILDIQLGLAGEIDKMAEVDDTWIQRKAFNEAIRPFARPLTIFDIPMELWSYIFEQVIGEQDDGNLWLFPDYNSGYCNIESIKNSRLACRRFCDASSPFLLRRVDVALEPKSLARLDRISRHPLFSTGVRAIRVDLSCYSYSSHWAQDESAFVEATIAEVCRWANIDQETLQLSIQGRAFFHSRFLPLEQFNEAVDKIGQAVAWWLSYHRSGCKSPLLDENDSKNATEIIAAITVVRECYQEYQRRYEAQQHRQLCGPSLARSVAEAVARMPNAVRLFMTDNMNYVCKAQRILGRPRIMDLLKDLNLLVCTRMLKPNREWIREEWDSGSQPPPARLLYLLPMAFHQARVPLLHLEVNVTWHHLATWEPDEYDIPSLRALAATLKVFDYQGPPDFPDIAASIMRQYLGALMSGQKLQKVGIEFRQEQAEAMEVGRLLESFDPGISMRDLTLRYCSLHLDELKSFLQKCNSDEMSLTLHGIGLLSGTWADALDLLRESVMRVSVQRPTGMECDHLSRDVYNELFGSGPDPDYRNSKANQYIANRPYHDACSHNPLRPEPLADGASPETETAHGTA